MPETPSRGIFLGPGSSGKTLTAQVMLKKHYKGVFKAIFISFRNISKIFSKSFFNKLG